MNERGNVEEIEGRTEWKEGVITEQGQRGL